MTPNTRTPTSYDPFADLESLGWRIEFRQLEDGATEQYDRVAEIVYMDPDAYAEDPEHATAHAAYHVRYDLEEMSGRMTLLQEANANSYAYLWLDREWAL